MYIDSISTSNINNSCFKKNKKTEFIDIIADNIYNPRDVQDCVAVPRGIFKAYILLMAASSIALISGVLPQKLKYSKMFLNISSAILSAASAVYFAKPFAFKGLSPTVTKNEVEKNNNSIKKLPS